MKKDKTIQNMILSILLIIGLIWLNTMIHQLSFQGNFDSFYLLKTALSAFLYTCIFYLWFTFEPSDVPIRNSAKMCAVGTAVSGVLMLLAILLELGTENFSLYGKEEIVLWSMSIPKKYVYYIWSIIWFPYNINVIIQAMSNEHFQLESLFYGCIAILGLTLDGILIFRPMTNIWLINLMLLNTSTVALAVWKNVPSEVYTNRWNAIAAPILYGLIRFALLPFQCDNWGQKFSMFMFGGGWDELVAGINEVILNSAFWDTSNYLLHSEYVHNWLHNRNMPLLQLMFLEGTFSVIFLILLLIGFLVLLMKLLGVENGREHRNWLIFATAAVMLFIRTIFGIFYSLGWLPYPIQLPFLGSSEGLVIDVAEFTLILFAAWENRQIQRYYHMDTTFVPAKEILGSKDSYIILVEKEYPYSEEVYEDEVDIIGEDVKIHCNAEWYDFYDRVFCVFTTRSDEMNLKRFILEYTDDGKWVFPQDSEGIIQKEISQQYIRDNRPACKERDVK